jgi:glycerol uptake operon antiterminator
MEIPCDMLLIALNKSSEEAAREMAIPVNQQQLIDELIESPVIAAVRDDDSLNLALSGPLRTLFLLSGTINGVAEQVSRVRKADKLCFLHVDLVEGLRPDQQGMRFIAEQVRPHGIITTKTACVRWAQNLGLFTVQRIFLLDSAALKDGSANVRTCRPDLVEVLPGVADKAIRLAAEAFDRPLIAGGLIRTREEVYAALAAGALAVSTGNRELWQL